MCEEGSDSKFGSEEGLNVFRTLEEASLAIKAAKAQHQNIVRIVDVSREVQIESSFNELFSSQPKQIFKAIKSRRR